MAVAESTVFLNNRTQAVRLPKAVAFPEAVKLVDVRVVGNSRVLTPLGQDWAYWAEQGSDVTADFCVQRDQPEAQVRQWGETVFPDGSDARA